MEAAEGGGGISVMFDICVAAISPSFPYKPTVGIVQRQKSRDKSLHRREKPKKKQQSYWKL
jgi:hypothetical protein